MNSTQRQALRQTLTDLGFEQSSTRKANLDPEARPGEYDESWINDNADEVEIRWAAQTYEPAPADLFIRLFRAIAASEALPDSQVDNVLAEFQTDFNRLTE